MIAVWALLAAEALLLAEANLAIRARQARPWSARRVASFANEMLSELINIYATP
jgi:hypothetical protein